MKHIDTTCAEETKARSDYSTTKIGQIAEADDKIEATVRELLALRHKMDEDALNASKLKALIMVFMKNAETLKSKSGTVLATWVPGSQKKEINYQAIMKKYGVTQADIDANTKYKKASRTFSIEEVE